MEKNHKDSILDFVGKLLPILMFATIGVFAIAMAMTFAEFSSMIIVLSRASFIVATWIAIDAWMLKGIDTVQALKDGNIAYAFVVSAWIIGLALCFNGI